VQIEARIVIVSDDFSRELGARAGFSGFDFFGNNLGYTSGSALANDQAMADFLERANDQDPNNDGVPFVFSDSPVQPPPRYNVNLPVNNPAGSIAYMLLGTGLPDRSRAVGGAGRRPRRGDLDAARHHREPARSQHRAGCGNSVPGIRLVRCDHDFVQEGRAGPQGHAAGHA
jgi:hypothetical protein